MTASICICLHLYVDENCRLLNNIVILRKNGGKIMPIQTKTEVVKMLGTRYNVKFTPVSGKKVFFDTNMNGNRKIVVCSPHSTIHKGGQGWIDLTKIQTDLMEEYDAALLAFR